MSHSFPARGLRRLALGSSAIALGVALATPAAAQSFQGNANVVFGSASVTTGTGTTDINVGSNSAVIDWTPFDAGIGGGAIGFQNAGTTATFTGPNANFAVLNRIVPNDTSRAVFFDGNVRSQFFGTQAPVQGGTIFFYSPGGIVLGQNAVFDVGRLGLTTAPPVVDANGGWYNGNTVQFGQSASGRAIYMSQGSRINAPMEGSYVAAFAPVVGHMGTINVNGQAALVSGEAGTITFSPSGLFDIQVSIGSDGDQNRTGLFVYGGITGPASSGFGDNHRIYLATIAKNNALTLSIQRGASLGFDVAGAANVDGNAVVLSAGYNITGGRADAARAGTATSDIFIDDNFPNLSGSGIDFTSVVDAKASGVASVYTVRQTNFASNLTMTGGERASIDVATNPNETPGALAITGNLALLANSHEVGSGTQDAGFAYIHGFDGATATVGGNLTVSASASRDVNGDGRIVAGRADSYLTRGAILTVGGNASFDARANSQNAVSPTAAVGGSAALDAEGGQLRITGTSRVEAQAAANTGGNATGGTAGSNILAGGSLTTNNLFIVAGADGGLEGGSGTGGSAALNVQNGSTANVGALEIVAFGSAGDRSTAGATGNGTGGNATISVQSSSTLTATDTTLRANGRGGFISTSSPANGSRSGNGTGGNAYLFLGGGTMTATSVDLSANGDGGFISATGSTGLVAGNGAGGFAVIQGMAGTSSLDAGFVNIEGSGSGGIIFGGIGTGGNATSLESRIDVLSGAALTVTAPINITAYARGGDATDGTGGNGAAGRAYTFSRGSLTLNGDVNIFIDGSGGGGAVGGSATGGFAYIQSDTGGSTTINGDASVFSNAEGGRTSLSTGTFGTGGSATGGSAQILATTGNAAMAITGDASVYSYAFAGDSVRDGSGNGGNGANATGGLAEVGGSTGTGNTVSIGGFTIVNSGVNGGTGAGSSGGDASGARAYLTAGDGTALTLGSVNLTAFAVGGEALANGGVLPTGSDRGGNASAGDVRIRTFNTGGTIDITGDAAMLSNAIGGNASGTPAEGGNADAVPTLVAARNGRIAVSGALSVDTSISGGSGARGGNATLGQGVESGLYAENATLRVDGGANFSSFANGGDGENGGAGGSATAVNLYINPNSAVAGASLIDLSALEMYSSAYGGAGGAGAGIAGGVGGDAQSGSIIALGSAGNGTLRVRGNALLYSFAVGGLGGDSDTATGGLGGDASSGRIQVGTKSGPDVGPVNSGSAQFGLLDVFSEATGGLGGQSSSGTGGAGGDAVSFGGVLLVRGSPVTASSATLSAYALGGDGGSGAVRGAGGYGAVADTSLIASQRFQRTDRGNANIGSLSLLSRSVGGQGSTPGASYYAAGGGINLVQSDVVLGDVTVDVIGDEPAPAALFTTLPAELRLNNATLSAGSVRISTPGEFLLDLDNATMTATDLYIAARDFVLPTNPPVNPGTITVANVLELISDPSGSVRTYATLISNGTANISSGMDIVLGSINTQDDLFLTSQTGLITVGNLTAGTIDLTAQGAVTTGNVVASGSFSAQSAAGAVTTGSISATSVDLVGQGPVATGNVTTPGAFLARSVAGSVTTGSLSAASVDLVAQGSVQTGAIVATGDVDVLSAASIALASVQARNLFSSGATGTTIGQVDAQSIDMTDAARVTANGRWTSPNIYIATGDLDIGANGSIVGGSNGSVTLVATNPGGAFIGDGLSGTAGYRLGNAEFSRISGRTVQFGAVDTQTNPVDLTIGTLSLTGTQFAGELGSLSFGTGSIGDGFSVSGRIRIEGAVSGTGFSSSQSLVFASDSFELNAETGSVALAGQGFGNLGGTVEIEANNIHVASPTILAKLRENPRYVGVVEEINAPAAVQRPDGVLRAEALLFYPGDTLYIQNTGTAFDPAGFLTTLDPSDIEPPGFEDPAAPDVDVQINGRFATATGIVSGRDVQGAIAGGDADFAGFSEGSSINGCAFTADVCSGGIDGGQPLAVIQSEIALLSGETLAEEPFATEDAEQEEEEQAEKAAAAPITPPVILIDTRPLNPPLDIVEPVSGSGNPAALVVTPANPGENNQ